MTLMTAKSYTVDFNQIYEAIGSGGLQFGFSLANNGFATIHLSGLGIGFYAGQETSFSSSIPQSLIGVLANGNELNTPITGESPAYISSVFKSGVYGSWNLGDVFGDGNTEMIGAGKLGFYTPIAYTEGDEAKFNYSFVTNSDGTINLTTGGNLPIYTALPLDKMRKPDGSFDPGAAGGGVFSQALSQGAGLAVDAGVTFRDVKTHKPLFGAALLNLPLGPARVKNRLNMNFYSSYTIAPAASSYGTGNNRVTQTGYGSTPTPETVNKTILLPMKLNGFYRFVILPFFDVIPEAEVVLWNPFRLNAGVTADLNLFNRLDFSLAVKRDDFAWKTQANVGIDLWLAELVINASLSGPDLGAMFNARGVNVGTYLAIGF